MTKADPTKLMPGRTRGPYSTQACDQCRRKKIKCNGEKPVCGSCESSKRAAECSWTGEPVRVPRTEAHFEALRKRVEALQSYADSLESMLEQCRREHGGGANFEYKQLRPTSSTLPDYFEPEEHREDAEPDIVQELAMSTENLKLEDRNLVVYGNVAPFRFAEVPDQGSRFNRIMDNPNAQYVLLVDGASDDYNTNLDWSKYLPKNVPLDRREHDKILDLLFKFFTSWCLRIVPALFLRDMYRHLSIDPPPVTSHYSPMLHNALIALATAFSDNPKLNDVKTRTIFAEAAKRYIEHECQKPNICVVQALSLLGSFHSSKGDQNLGYLYFGMSMRVAEILGLNVDCSRWVNAGLITHDDMLDRNWVFWTGYSLDVCWSLYVGRDCSVTMATSSQAIPVPFVDSDFDEIPWHYKNEETNVSIPPQPNYLSRTFAKTCELLVTARKIMEVVNGLHNPNSPHRYNDEVISRLDLQLNSWKGGLSHEVDITLSNRNTSTPHKLMMHLIYWLCFILLHRPLFNKKTRPGPIYSSDREIDHVKLCKRAAENIMDLLATWHRLYGLRYAPVTLFQAVFSAGTIFLMAAVQAASPSKPRLAKGSLMNSLSQVELCVQYLKEVGKSWQSASNIAEILNRLCRDQLKPLLERNMIGGIGTDERHLAPHDTKRSPQLPSPSSPTHLSTSPGAVYSSPPPLSSPSSSSSSSSYIQQTFETDYAKSLPTPTWSTAGAQLPISANFSRAPDQGTAHSAFFTASAPSYLTGGEMLANVPYVPQVMDNYVFNQAFDTSYNMLVHELGLNGQPSNLQNLDVSTLSADEFTMLAQSWM